MAEWLKARLSKSRKVAISSRVRIPVSPPKAEWRKRSHPNRAFGAESASGQKGRGLARFAEASARRGGRNFCLNHCIDYWLDETKYLCSLSKRANNTKRYGDDFCNWCQNILLNKIVN